MRIFNAFSNLRIRKKMLISYIIIILLSVSIISVSVYKIYENDTVNSTIAFSHKLSQQISFNISYKMSDFEKNTLLKIDNYPDLFNNSNNSNFLNSKRLYDFCSDFVISNNYVRQVYIEDIPKNNYIYDKFSMDVPNDKALSNFANQSRKKIISNWGSPSWFTLQGSPNLIYMSRAIYNKVNLKYQGLIVVALDRNYITELYENTNKIDNNKVLIYFEDGSVIYDNNLDFNETNEFKKYLFPYFDIPIEPVTLNHEKYLLAGSVSSNNKWIVLNIISNKDLFLNVDAMRNVILLTCLASIAIAFLIAIFISRSITSNLSILLTNIRRIGKGDFNIRIEPKNSDEIGELALEFNKMVSKLNQMIIDISDEKLKKEKAEYKQLEAEFNALQAQINPHMINNVLESINSMAKLNNQSEISEVITRFGVILRESITNKKRMIPFSEELVYVDNYIFLQKIMMQDRIAVEFDIDQETLEMPIPKLILQPIVENAILHGIDQKKEGGTIVISAHIDRDLIIEVSDNGVGMDSAAIERLFDETIEKTEGKHIGIGVRSVDKRIKMIYGNEYGLRINSEIDMGTTIEVILPIHETESL